MRLNCVLVLCEQQLQHFESFVFTCLTYKNVQRFPNGQVHKFYGLKASQMSKVHASSHEYPHVEKVKNVQEQNFKGEVNNKQLDSDEFEILYFN